MDLHKRGGGARFKYSHSPSTPPPHTQNISIVMEYFPLGNLRHLIQRTRDTRSDDQEGVEFRLFLSICVDVCEGVAFLHKRQIFHSNLKPENVLVVSHMVG